MLHTLASAHLPLVVLAVGLSLLHALLRAERWCLMLPPERPDRRCLYYYFLVANGLGMVMPAGSGETLRVYLLKRRHGIPVAPSLAVTMLEKLFEGVGLMVIVAPLPFLLPLSSAASAAIFGLLSAGTVVLLGVVVFATRSDRRGWITRSTTWRRALPGLTCVRDTRAFVRLTALSATGLIADCCALSALLAAVDVHTPWAAPALVTLAMSFALVVPLVPGHVGTLEAGAVGGLHLLGVALAPALAFALVCHAVQTVHVVFALPGLHLLREARGAEAAGG